MARIRTVKPDFFKHEELYQAEYEYKLPLRLAFIGLWCVADREGRFKWKPNQLKLDILPYDKCDFSHVLDALAARGYIVQYQDECDNFYGFIPTFNQHQVINNRESQSVIIDPFDASVTRDPRGLTMHKGKGKEGKGKERKELSRKNPVYEDYPEFLEFWSAYPRKDDKRDSFNAWLKMNPPIDKVLFSLSWQKESDQWTKNNGQYIPLGATYINGARWEAEPPLNLGVPF